MSTSPTSVHDLLLQQQHNIAQLTKLLHEEKKSLGQYNPENLDVVVEQKNILLKQIQEFDNTLANTPDVVAEIKQGIHNQIMTEISDALAECKQLNEINGAVIAQSQITVNRIRTSILEGQGKSSVTYDEKAKTSTGMHTLNIKA